MSIKIALGVHLASGVSGPSITQTTGTTNSELIVDGQTLNDLSGLAVALNTASWTSSEGGTIAISTPVVTRTTAGLEVPSSLTEIQEQSDEVNIAFVVSDGLGTTRSVSIDYFVYPIATQATAGNLVLSLDLESGVDSTPFTDMFEPVSANDNWSATDLSISLVGAPTGVTLVGSGMEIDTATVAAQTNTIFTVVATDTVTVEGVDTVRTATKTVDLTAAANTITIVTSPAFVQGFEGGIALDDSNRTTLLNPSNYTGLTDAFINVRLRVDGSPAEILTHEWSEGEVAVLYVDIWNNSRVPADGAKDAGFESAAMTVQQLLTLSATSGTSLTVTTNAAAPDAYPVNNVTVNGRDIDSGLTVADFEDTQMVLIQSPLFTAASGTDLGDFTTYTPPTIVAPSAATVTVTFDLLDNADDSVLLADQTSTGDTITDEVVAGRQGKTVKWRAKFRASGYTNLDVDSGTIAIAAGGYTQKTFNAGANGHYTYTPASGTETKALFTGYFERPSGLTAIIRSTGGIRIDIQSTGAVVFRIAESNNNAIFSVTTTDLVAATGKTFVGIEYDVVTGLGNYQIGSVITAISATAEPAKTIGNGSTTVFRRQPNDDRQYSDDFSDLLLQFGGAVSLATVYNSGTPVDISGYTAELILGGTMTAADFNSATQLGTATLTLDVGDDTFTEVV